MFEIGLNPYGLAYTVGLQAAGTPRGNPQPLGLDGFIALVHELGFRCIELDWRWMTPLSAAELDRLRGRLEGMTRVYSYWLAQKPGESITDEVTRAHAIGASIIRLHLTPVLEGARGRFGARWDEMMEHARRTLAAGAQQAADAGLTIAIENHQDVGSEELLDLAASLGAHAGLVLDTGNPFAVGEDPVAFVRRAAHRIRHVHLKDYVAQFTDEGFRLVRCAVGDGCVPFAEIASILAQHGAARTASIEPGALEARHIRLFTRDWWNGYKARSGREVAIMLGRLRTNRLGESDDFRTPWERGASGPDLVAYEMGQLHRSVEHLRALGWLR